MREVEVPAVAKCIALAGLVGMSTLVVPRIPYAARLVRLLHRVEAEPELGARHLLGGVLVTALEAGEAGDAHDQEAVTLGEVGDRGLGGDGDLDPVARLHDPDGQRVRRVEAHLDPLLDDRLRLVGGEVAPRDGGGSRREHVVSDSEAEVGTHLCLL